MTKAIRLATLGVSPCPSWRLEAGPPFTIGSEGDWRVHHPTLLPVHALAYFDGETLHVSSADEDVPAFVDGHPLPTSWTPLRRSCRLNMGAVAFDVLLGFEHAPAPSSLPAAGATTQRTRASSARLQRIAPVAAVGLVAIVLFVVVAAMRHRQGHATVANDPPPAPAANAPPPSRAAAPMGVVVHPVMHPARTRIGKTPERVAADAFHTGDTKRAAALYAELAAQSPDNAAFAAIATMLREP